MTQTPGWWLGHFDNMDPDDFMKRGYLLPEGCKDLIDAWKAESYGLPRAPSSSDWREKLKRLKDDYSKSLADPDLNDSERVKLEWILKELRDYLGEGD